MMFRVVQRNVFIEVFFAKRRFNGETAHWTGKRRKLYLTHPLTSRQATQPLN
jgi:hypothetical protein